ncbi:hypothetical protein MANI_002882 [Metarhizium anisopliae]
MRVPLLVAALPLVSALPRALLDKRAADTVDSNRGRAADVSWNGQNDYSSSRGRDGHPSWQGKDRDPSWQGKDHDPSWEGKDSDPSWQGKDSDPSWQGKDSDPSWQGEDNNPSWNGPSWPEDPYFPDFPEDNDLPEDDCPLEDDDQPDDNDQPEDDQPEEDCPDEDESPNPGDNTPPKPSATTTTASDKPVATQTEPVVSATPSPTEVPPSNDEPDYMAIVHKWLRDLNLRPLKYDAELAKTALQCSKLSNGALTHRGNNAQIMAPGKEMAFEHVFVGGWLGERKELFSDEKVWKKFSQGWNYMGQTGHADALADKSTYQDGTPVKLTKIGCGWAGGSNGGQQWNMWTCDLA